MKHIFIVNPKSGKKDSTEFISNYLKSYHADLDYEVYNTKQVSDATRYVRKKCEEFKDQEIRFYACGGDGTLNEVVNGACGYDHAYVTVYPCGSGNDFVKTFGPTNHFKDISKLINGKSRRIDLLEVNGRYSINMCNVGFDGSVANNVAKFKKWPLVTGKGAYNLSIIYSLIFKTKFDCKIEIDNEPFYEGKILLSAQGNGICCGGSYYCLPKASVEDGLIDAVFIKKISRFKFIKLISKYKNGTYLEIPKFSNIIMFKKCKELKLTSTKYLPFCLDGECGNSKTIEIKIKEKALNFIVPVEYVNSNENLTN